MYSKTFQEGKYREYQYMELSRKRVSAAFLEFLCVASFMFYTLHPTTFYQSGVYVSVKSEIFTDFVRQRRLPAH